MSSAVEHADADGEEGLLVELQYSVVRVRNSISMQESTHRCTLELDNKKNKRTANDLVKNGSPQRQQTFL